MSDAYVEKIAGELAELAMADEKRTDDEKIVAEIGEIVGASSQTLQEAYLTAVRVRRAEKRARKLLADRASEMIIKTQRLLTDESGTDGGDAERAALKEAQREEEELQNLLDSMGDDQTPDTSASQTPDVIVPPSPSGGVTPNKPNRS